MRLPGVRWLLVGRIRSPQESRKISENFCSRIPLIYVRPRSLFLALLWIALLSGQTPPAANPKKEYLERRATILRQMAEIKAKLASLELELQLLEESRSADPAAPLPPTSWREEPGSPDGNPKKATARCLSVTRDGKRCTRPAEAGLKYCWQHRHH